jgi:hypothetical protein
MTRDRWGKLAALLPCFDPGWNQELRDKWFDLFHLFKDMEKEATTNLTYALPLPGSDAASITLPVPLKKSEWDLIMRVLEAMRPGLVLAEKEGDDER